MNRTELELELELDSRRRVLGHLRSTSPWSYVMAVVVAKSTARFRNQKRLDGDTPLARAQVCVLPIYPEKMELQLLN